MRPYPASRISRSGLRCSAGASSIRSMGCSILASAAPTRPGCARASAALAHRHGRAARGLPRGRAKPEAAPPVPARQAMGSNSDSASPGSKISSSSKSTMPLHRRLHPCSGWQTIVRAAVRSGASAAGQAGMWRHAARSRPGRGGSDSARLPETPADVVPGELCRADRVGAVALVFNRYPRR
jgi:hypothetical protein